ncbi:MAG: RNA polymerase sigma factor [Patescibacteria group bacterium]
MKAISKYKEKILLHKVRENGDTQAFAELYDLYIEKIYRFVFLKVSNKEEAEDITSEVFLKVWNYLISENASQKKIKSFSGLIYSIARNLVIDFYRKKINKNECLIEKIEEMNPEELVGENKIENTLDLKYDINKVMIAIRELKKEYQELLLLKYIEELSVIEISEITGKGQTNIRVTLHRALKILKKELEK